MKFGLRFWAWNFFGTNTENHRPECTEKIRVRNFVSNFALSRFKIRVAWVPKIRVFGAENPRKIRVGQESVGLNDWGGGGRGLG